MLHNHLIVAWRQARRRTGFALLNVAGLGLGVTCCVLILLYVHDELTFDRFHSAAERIVRLQVEMRRDGLLMIAPAPADAVATLPQDVPGLEAATVTQSAGRVVVSRGATRYYEEGLLYADAAFLSMFDFRVSRGDPQELARPGTVFLSPAVARRYFGDADPVGQTLTVDGTRSLDVVGLLEPVPSNSTLRFELLASLETLRAAPDAAPAFTPGAEAQAFVLLRRGVALESVIEGIEAALITAGLPGWERRVLAEPLTALHLHSLASGRQSGLGGNLRYIYVFGGVALLILAVACVNFLNLTTARAMQRAREIGVRKSLGAARGQLVRQFLAETTLLAVIAVGLGVLLVELALPGFNQLVDKRLTLLGLGGGLLLPGLAALVLVIAAVAGLYPALVLSRFDAARALKGQSDLRPGSSLLRQGLVVFQFAVAIALVVGVLTIRQQLDHMRGTNLGLQPDQVLVLTPQEGARTSPGAFADALRQVPGIERVAFGTFPEGIGVMATQEGAEEGGFVHAVFAGPGLIQTLQMELAQGRSPDETPTDLQGAVVVNETAAREWGWDEPLGRTVEVNGSTREVVGVVRDFHTVSLKQRVMPRIVVPVEDAATIPVPPSVIVRLRAGDVPSALSAMASVWNGFAPNHPFEYQFLDERFARLYRSEVRLSRLVAAFSMLAVVIACLGLFGLAAHAAERRTKEIGVRKVLGATVASIVALMASDFARLVVLAFVLATPPAYWAMSRWLEDFAHRITLSPTLFVTAGLLALSLALATVATQALRAALADPVRSLRSE